MMRSLLPVLLAVGTAAPALAQDDAPADPPQRVRSVILYGDQQCPKPENDGEIVVCANGGESPYRIPKAFRERDPGPEGTSWVRRAELVEEVNRVNLPGSCTPVGSFGQSGCTLQAIQRWKAEMAEKKVAEAGIP